MLKIEMSKNIIIKHTFWMLKKMKTTAPDDNNNLYMPFACLICSEQFWHNTARH